MEKAKPRKTKGRRLIPFKSADSIPFSLVTDRSQRLKVGKGVDDLKISARYLEVNDAWSVLHPRPTE